MNGSLQDLLSQKKLPNIITLFGEEDFLVLEAYRKIVTKFTETHPEAQVEIYDVEELSEKEEFVEILDKVLASSFFFAEKLIVFKNIEKIFSKKSKKDKLDTHEFLLKRIILDPPENVFIIFISFDENLFGISKKYQKDKNIIEGLKFPFDLLLKLHYWLEFPKMYENQIRNWFIQRAKEIGLFWDNDALDFFFENTNLSLWELNNELEKITSFLGNQKKVTLSILKSVLSVNKEINIFEITSLISKRDFSGSINFIEQVLSFSRQELLLLNLIYKYFKNLLVLFETSKESNDKNLLAKSIGVSYYFFEDYLIGLRNYSKNDVENALKSIAHVDHKLKSSAIDTKYLFYNLLWDIMNKKVS
ncbi:MAG: DNA polymerase III subunit delta [Ignavibacteria bacterium]|nr:DNA polymerase III subunit delta [Ignavibacteria bacterium]